MKPYISLFKKSIEKFWWLHKPLVFKNNKFRNIHVGETCYIISNGGSLKFYDISKIPNLPTIVCSYSLIDNRLKDIDVRYFFQTDSYLNYPILFNTYPHVRKFQKNRVKPVFAKIFKDNRHVNIFTNITNFYSTLCRRKNIYYYYHFGDRLSNSYDLSGNFSQASGALDIMLGAAKYFGFKKAILLGCDYLGSPPVMGHFYADYKPYSGEYLEEYCERVRRVSDGIDIVVVLPEGVTAPGFDYTSYESFFGLEKQYCKNFEFIDDEYIDLLRLAHDSTQTIMKEE